MQGNNLEHHKRNEYCRTRLKYRQSKELTAVKVYTVANESKHLLIFGVPKINLYNEIKRSIHKFGPIKLLQCITEEIIKHPELDFEIEQFTDVYHVQFEKIHNARKAKKFLDAKNFYGGILHLSYAPEYESVDDIREKLKQRKSEVQFRIRLLKNSNTGKRIDHTKEKDEPGAKRRKL